MNIILHMCFLVGFWKMVIPASTGAKEAACDAMLPQHVGVPQSQPAPYDIMLTPTKYGCTMPSITVTIVSINGTYFRGFLCQPRTDVDVYKTYGSIPLDDSVTNNCGNATAVTHVDSSMKSAISFSWIPPTYDVGTVYIVCTIVRSWTVFWHQVCSEAIEYSDNCSTTPINTGNSTTNETSTTPVWNTTLESENTTISSTVLTSPAVTSDNNSVNPSTVSSSPLTTTDSASVNPSLVTTDSAHNTTVTSFRTLSTDSGNVTVPDTSSSSSEPSQAILIAKSIVPIMISFLTVSLNIQR